MKRIKAFGGLLKASFKGWQEDKASRLAAALSYYTIFSLGPIIMLVLTILGFIYRDGSANRLFLTQVVGLVGESGGEVIQSVMEAASKPAASTWAAIISVVTAIIGSTGVFVQLKDSLNTVWGITEKRFHGLQGLVRVRAVSFTAIIVIGFLMLVSLFVSTALSAALALFGGDDLVQTIFLQIFNQAVSIGLITVLFAFIYKYLPDAKVAWRDVWIGALFTSVLFNIGKFLIGIYLGNSNVGSNFGAAGSLLVILVWVYYSAQLILFGAEFTQAYSSRYGSRSLKEQTTEEDESENKSPIEEKGQE